LQSGAAIAVTHQNILDAMDGIAMILDDQLRITNVGQPNWRRSFEDNAPHEPRSRNVAAENVLDRSFIEFIAGETVRETVAALFNSVLHGARAMVNFDYRCDVPNTRRDMHLSVRRILTDCDTRYLLYQSVMISDQQRPAIPLFGAPVADHCGDDILTLCTICARVAWPVGAQSVASVPRLT